MFFFPESIRRMASRHRVTGAQLHEATETRTSRPKEIFVRHDSIEEEKQKRSNGHHTVADRDLHEDDKREK